MQQDSCRKDSIRGAIDVLYVGGGGDENDSIKLDQLFARNAEGKRLLYLPIAMGGISPTYEDCHAWLQSVFGPLGITDIVMWDTLRTELNRELTKFDAVYLGGGNTYQLLDQMRKTGFDVALKDFTSSGRDVYGGSAGAIVLGRDISTCAVMDSNDVCLEDTTGLGLIENYAIWCHYVEDHDSLVASYDFPIIAIPERSGILFDGSTIRVVGFDAVTVFDHGSKTVLLPDQTYPIAS